MKFWERWTRAERMFWWGIAISAGTWILATLIGEVAPRDQGGSFSLYIISVISFVLFMLGQLAIIGGLYGIGQERNLLNWLPWNKKKDEEAE